jgi:hypothetical protein
MRADLTRTTYLIGRRAAGIRKTAGLPQSVSLQLEAPRQFEAGVGEFRIAGLKARTGPCTFDGAGRARLDIDALRRGRLPGAALRAVRDFDLKAELRLAQQAQLKDFSEWWRRLSEQFEFTGQASATIEASGTRDSGRIALAVGATSAGFSYGEGTHKPVGTEARVDMVVKRTQTAGQLTLEQVTLRIADTSAGCTGTLYCSRSVPFMSDEPVDFELHLEGRSEELARLVQLLPVRRLRRLEPRGGLEFALDVARDRFGTEVRAGRFDFRRARVKLRGSDVSVDGRLDLSRERLTVEALALGVADSSIVVAADIASPLEAPRGRFTVTGNRVNLDQWVGVLGIEPPADAPPGIPPEWPAVSRFLGRMHVRGRLALDRFTWRDKNACTYDWRAFATDLAVADGRLDVANFKAVMLGGVVAGRLSADLSEPNPTLRTEYVARDLKGGEGLQPLITLLFPDMTVSGTASQVHQTDQALFATVARANYPVGVSRFEATDGLLQGPAAPEAVTRLLPGLKLTTYRFARMESQSQLLPNGRSESTMLFDGSPYAVYIQGHTDADGTAEYSLGVDLFNSLQWSEPLRNLEQGRVPLLVYTGRIADRKWVERDIRYKLPHEIAWEVFVKRSLLYKLLNQSGEKRRPDFSDWEREFLDREKAAADDGGR